MNPFFSPGLRSKLTLAAFALVATGCSINYSPDSLGAQTNSCTADDECASGAACVSDRCVGTNVDLSDLIVEVRPNSGASYGASMSFLYPANKTFSSSSLGDAAFDVVHDITLRKLGKITAGMVHLDYNSKCNTLLGKQFSVPATITFDHVSDLAGFRFDSYTVSATKDATSNEYVFDAKLVPGKYSVYIQPQPVPGCTEELPPPVFYPAQDILASSDGEVMVTDWAVIKPTTLEGEIEIPKNGDLTGWRLDIVEPTGGRVISTTQTLQQGMVSLVVKVRLSFVWNDKTTSPYIRLRPPEGEARPSVYWGLIESLSSQSKTSVHLSVANLHVDPRQVEIQVQDEHHKGVVASVQVQSVKLSGDVEKNAAFAVDIPTTDDLGFFKLSLPPGTYQLRARPLLDSASSLATGDLDLVIPALDSKETGDPCFCGHVIQVARKAPVSGSVVTPMGTPLVGASITLSPSQPDAVNYWKRVVHAIDPRPLTPRAEIASIGDMGEFAMRVDPGPSDLTVRPGEQSGYPWLVRPRLNIPAGTGAQLGMFTLPNSAILRGVVTSPDGALASNVVVNGWLPVKNADGSAPTTVIQIGSTTTDERGEYTLVLPAAIPE